jgi:anthranilate synthase component 2
VVRNDSLSVEDIRALKPEAIVLSPGPGRPEEAGICLELIRTFAPTIPILGICLGHQAIGMAFGGAVVSAPEILHGKKSQVFHSRKGLFKGCLLPLSVGRYHSLVIDKRTIPACLSIEGEDAKEVIMAIRHKEFPCYGVQFHPESILTAQGELMMRNFFCEAGVC